MRALPPLISKTPDRIDRHESTKNTCRGHRFLLSLCNGKRRVRMKCPKCGCEKSVKYGTARGRQRFKCAECGCQFTRETSRVRSLDEKWLAMTLLVSGLSMTAAAKALGVSVQSVMRWKKIRQISDRRCCESPARTQSVQSGKSQGCQRQYRFRVAGRRRFPLQRSVCFGNAPRLRRSR